jgi:purine-nucleoside phosphorylase
MLAAPTRQISAPAGFTDVMSYYEHVAAAAEAIRRRVGLEPTIAVVLGTGLGRFTDVLQKGQVVPYGDLPHWPVPGVVGHAGQLVVGHTKNRAVAALSGRCHAYEGVDLQAVTFAVRVMGLLGVTRLILTNAAGAINTSFRPGTLMLLDDHINLIGGNPLVGANDDRFGPRSPDLSSVYSAGLRALADEAGQACSLRLEHGVYAAVLGPSYETPAEIRYLRAIGADAVGMSTVPEAIVARHMGIEVLGISCITNMAAGIDPGVLDHHDVLETARKQSGHLVALLDSVIGRL